MSLMMMIDAIHIKLHRASEILITIFICNRYDKRLRLARVMVREI